MINDMTQKEALFTKMFDNVSVNISSASSSLTLPTSNVMQFGGGNKSYIHLIKHKHAYNKKFKLSSDEYVFKFKDIDEEFAELSLWLKKGFEEIISYITKKCSSQDLIGIKMSVPKFINTKPIGLYYMNAASLTADMILKLLESVIQSNSEFDATDELEISTSIVHKESSRL